MFTLRKRFSVSLHKFRQFWYSKTSNTLSMKTEIEGFGYGLSLWSNRPPLTFGIVDVGKFSLPESSRSGKREPNPARIEIPMRPRNPERFKDWAHQPHRVFPDKSVDSKLSSDWTNRLKAICSVRMDQIRRDQASR